MVQTRSAARRVMEAHGHTDDIQLPQNDTVIESPPADGASKQAKRARREDATASKKRRRGKPGELCQLNLDVLFLIAAYIHPLDLLNLARTCRSLRELLMDKSSTFVWKTARQQVKGLPECPTDLTEPEFANLVFFAHCYGCEKYTMTVYWNLRRRYCSNCRIRRLRRLSGCAEVIRTNRTVVPTEYIEVKKEYNTWCDRDQVASFMEEYRQAADKEQFISDKQSQCGVISQHAMKCYRWQLKKRSERREEQNDRRMIRRRRIFDLLEENGYQREISFAGSYQIERLRESDFKTSRTLTDNEWNRIWPEWRKIMDDVRSRRINNEVFQPRLRLLVPRYIEYRDQSPPNLPSLDLFPFVIDIARFPLFWNILNAPEETTVNEESFTPAFDQLPLFVTEWRKRLDEEVAKLIQIPRYLSPGNVAVGQIRAPNKTTRTNQQNVNSDKLGLACALFSSPTCVVLPHPEVFLFSSQTNFYFPYRDDVEQNFKSILDRYYRIEFFEEAPYIVHACGLDPNVAKIEDMDRRNARLICLCCDDRPNIVVDWRNAMRHARLYHISLGLPPLSESPRWQLVDEEHVDAIKTAEQSRLEKNMEKFPEVLRCVLCKTRIWDSGCEGRHAGSHMRQIHKLMIEDRDIKRGEHYETVGMYDSKPMELEMVEDGEKVAFVVRE